MEKSIKKIKLFPNNNEKSIAVANELIHKLRKNGYTISDEEYDLAIAIGGDGSFLRMVKNCNFDDEVYYIGVNAGTLGFAQEIYPTDIDGFLSKLRNEEYKVEKIGVEETTIYTSDSVSEFCSLNEILVRDKNLNTTHLDIYINENLLEHFAGDGVMISTSFGSTAYNLSFRGSIVYNDLHTLQITPIAPINSRSFQVLRNSVIIPEHRTINIVPNDDNKQLLITVDGENNKYDNVSKIETSVKRKIKCLHMREYDYTKKINEKFL